MRAADGPVRWGFLGAGFIASRALAPAVHAADGAVLQVAGAREPARAEALGPIRAVGSYAEVCTSEDVDAVYIALANDDHITWVLAALAAGKHVLCEKPLGLDAGEVDRMTAAARDAGLLLVEAGWNRWHPRTRRFEELVAELAGPRSVETRFTFTGVPGDNYRMDPRRGGGALLDVGYYAVGAALLALGTDAAEVREAEQHLGPTGVDLTTSALLAHRNGTARITASIEQPESQVISVRAAGISLEFVGQAFTSWHEPSALRITSEGVTREEFFGLCDPYRLMVEAVSDRIRGGDAWVLPLSTTAAVAGQLDAIIAAASR